jgi:hypothetical protein
MIWFFIIVGLGIALFIALGIFFDLKRKKEGVQIEMIRARLMLLSANPQEIQEFLECKEPYITKDMIEQLINRVAGIRAEEMIDEDWGRKSKLLEKV